MSTSTRANRQGTAPPAQPQRSTPPAPANPGCHTCANLSGMLRDSITREKATQDACNKAQAQTLRLQAEARHYASEKATLERLLAEKDTQIAVLTANNVRCLASPTPQSVTMSDQSPDARAPISRDSKKDERISNNDRHTMIRLFDYFSNDRPDLTSKDICLGIIRTLAPGWSKVEHKHIIQWKNDVKLGIDRFKKRSRDEETQAELEQQRQEWLAKIRLFLRPLLHENAIFSVTHATDYLSGKWPSSWGATPTRYAVYKAFKELNITVTRISASSLSAAEIDARIFMFRLELAFLCVKYNISPKMTLNIDESALRLIPTRQYAWCLNGIAGPSDLLRRFPLRRQYTTSTACVSMHGEKLAPMVNWKGTDRLKVPGFDGKVHQFAQESTHWNTTESFLAYVRDVVLPYCESKKPEAIADGYSGLFLLVIDCAPIHISKKTRSALGSLLKGKGMALFLPAGCTDKVQPLDIKCFGVVKPAARAEHLELLTETLEYRPLDERRKLLSTTAEVRHMALHSLAWGFAALHASTVREAWDVCTGVTQVVAGKVERVRGGWGVHSKELFDTASARFATEAGRRAERKYKVERAEQTGAPLERDPSLSSLMFRFGVPGIDDIECIEDVAEEAERDALGFDETRLQYVDDLPTGVNPDDGDERDDLKAFECVDEESDDDVEGGEISSALVTRTRMMDGGRN